MINAKISFGVVSLMLMAQPVFAGQVVGVDLGRPLSFVVGGALPFEIGSVAAIAAVSLIIGAQLIKRKK